MYLYRCFTAAAGCLFAAAIPLCVIAALDNSIAVATTACVCAALGTMAGFAADEFRP